jgi:hypothetical protein
MIENPFSFPISSIARTFPALWRYQHHVSAIGQIVFHLATPSIFLAGNQTLLGLATNAHNFYASEQFACGAYRSEIASV